jgi:RNA polymerase sigma factor (sigma-70 family)
MRNPGDREPEGTDERRSSRCSFCLKSWKDVSPLVEGPVRGEFGRAYICHECVELRASILDIEKQRGLANQGETAASQFNSIAQPIDEVLKTLTNTQREVVKLRYGLGDGYTYTVEEVAQSLDITAEAVQEIEKRAVTKLRSQNEPPHKP